MLTALKKALIKYALPNDLRNRVDQAPLKLNSVRYDDWGLDPDVLKATLAATIHLYRNYFRVRTIGIDRVPQGRVLLIANHGGQLPFDGMLIGVSMLADANPPRVVRGMVERWFPAIPFISPLFVRCGQMVGDIHNCTDLLNNDQCVLVFPEGVRGSGKPWSKRYELQRFGTGFVRLALETGTPIVPVGVIGCEETYPTLFHMNFIGKLFGAPYFPITPLFPLLGPLGVLPLPAKVLLNYGEPLRFTGSADAPDSEIEEKVEIVKAALRKQVEEGIEARGNRIFL